MAIDKLLAGDKETVLLIPATEINGVPWLYGSTLKAPMSAPTTAILNYWIAVQNNSSANFGAGGNITGALKDDMKLGLADSSTDKDRTINSLGNAEALTFFNFNSDMTIFRNSDPLDLTSTFNLAEDLIRAPDLPYVIAHRVGKQFQTVSVVGDEWDFYYAWTDNPIPGYTDGGNQQVKQAFIPKNLVNISYILAA